MKRRWIIRGFFIALLLLSFIGWAWSALYYGKIRYASGGRDYSCRTTLGMISFGTATYRVGPSLGPDQFGRYAYLKTKEGWSCDGFRQITPTFIPLASGNTKHVDFGFSLGTREVYLGRAEFEITSPWWAVIVVVSALLWLVWRKTRPKPNSRTAFPVEAKKST